MKTSIILFLIALLGGLQPQLMDLDTSNAQPIQPDSLQIGNPVATDVVPQVKIAAQALDWKIATSQLFAQPMVSASKSYMMVGTDLGPLGPSSGDTIEYQVDITNSLGAMDATGVIFSDMIDANTTLVPGSVKTSPIAVDDNYTTVGNVSISVPVGTGLLVNDIELDGDMISVSSVNTAGTQGEVTFNANGSFTFNPAAGFEGTTTFTYNVTDGDFTRTGTVSILVTGMIWFIQSGASMGGDGRLGSPFDNISSYNSTANDEANDNIFLYSGAYTGSLTLLNGQNVIGQSAVGSLAGLAGVTFSTHPPLSPLPTLGGSTPTITNSVTTLTAAMNNDIYAVTINNSGGTALTGNNLGTLRVRDLILSNTSGIALNLSNGALDLILKSVSSSNASHGLRLQNTTGSLEVTGAGTTDGSGGTFSNISTRAIELISATNITLSNVIFNNGNTVDSGFDGVCDEDDNINCNAAIYLKDVTNMALHNIDITTTEEHGINGNNVTNLTISNSTSTQNGNSNEENALKLRNLFGTCSFTDCTFSLSAFRIAHIINTSGTLSLMVDNCVFNNTISSMVGADCFEMRTQGSAIATVNLKNSDFQRAASKGIQAIAEGSSTFNLNITNCNIERFNQPMAGIEVGSVNTAVMNYNIIGNPLIEAAQEVAVLASTLNTSTLNGRVTNNSNISALPAAASIFSNIRVLHEQNSLAKVEIENNLASSTNLEIPVIGLSRFGNNAASRLDIKLAGNTVTQNTAMGLEGIELRVGTSTLGTGINTLCANVLNNTVTVPSGQRAFRARIIDPTSFMAFQGMGTDVPTNWTNNVNMNSMGSMIVGSATAPAMITFGSICSTPMHPLPPSPPPPVNDTAGYQDLSVTDSIHDIFSTINHITTDGNPEQTDALLSMSGETVTVGGMSGFTIPENKSITIIFQVKVNDPLPGGICLLSNQGTVTGSNFSNVLTDDPNVGGTSDPTVTEILIPPVITICQDDISVGTDPDLCSASVQFSSTVTGCPTPTLTYMIGNTIISSPHDFPIGMTTVDVKASNGVMPDDDCSFVVTVTDDQAPVLTCLTGTQMRNTAAMACLYTIVGTEFDPVVNENCPGYMLTNDLNNLSSLNGEQLTTGIHNIKWTITDGAGLIGMCSVSIQIADDTDPVMSCPASESTDCNIADLAPYQDLAAFISAGGSVSDNCAIDNTSFMYVGQTGGPVSYMRTYQVADVNGNTASCVQTVTVSDIVAPEVTAGTIAACYQTLEMAETAAIANTTATDNCPGMLDYSVSTAGDCNAMITVTVADVAGNTASTVYNTRIDGEAPVVTKGMIAMCYSSVADAEMAALIATSATDNCVGNLTEMVSTVGACSAIITVTITDECGNSKEVTYNTRIDNVAPTVTKGMINTCFPSVAAAEAAAIMATNAEDNCPGVVKSASTVGDCVAVVTVTATDVCGNTAQTSYNTRIDNIPPMVTMGTIASSYPSIAQAESAALVATTATDNCSGILMKTASSTGECSLVITVIVSDSCGNSTPVMYLTSIDLAGQIGNDATICAGDKPAKIVETISAGGTGILTYRWQKSIIGCSGTFEDILGATGVTFEPPVLTQTTYYRRIVTSTVGMVSCSDTTNCVTITVNQVGAGSIGNNQTICAGTTPTTIMQLTPATGSSLTYMWQQSNTGCSGVFTDIQYSNAVSYDPAALFTTTTYRRIAISTLNMNVCRDTSNCVTITVRSLEIESIEQQCIDNSHYNLRICLDVMNPGLSEMFYVEVNSLNLGPFEYASRDANGCIVVSHNSFNPLDFETFNIKISDADALPGGVCSDLMSFTETICFQCPEIGSLQIDPELCKGVPITIKATGLKKMAFTENSETDFGIRFVAFMGGVPANPYSGGLSLGTVSYPNLSMSGTIASLNNFDPASLGLDGSYSICAILDPPPILDASCRPFQSKSITLRSMPVINGSISGPAVVCSSLQHIAYAIAPLYNANIYNWSFSNGTATIFSQGESLVYLNFSEQFTGGILSVKAMNECGESAEQHISITLGSPTFCELTSCFNENQNITITNELLMQLGSPDVYKAINQLQSGATIQALRSITFKAGHEILMNPPFNVQLGATFIAEIEPCIFSVLNH